MVVLPSTDIEVKHFILRITFFSFSATWTRDSEGRLDINEFGIKKKKYQFSRIRLSSKPAETFLLVIKRMTE